MRKIYKNIINDSLYRNSSYLLVSNIVAAFFGFIFWSVATRFFSAREVGLASTLISSSDLVVSFALLGLNIGLVRFLPASDSKNDKINSVFTVTTFTLLIASLAFILGLKYFSPELVIVHERQGVAIMFVVFVVFLGLSESIKSVFRSFRSSQYVLLKNTVFNVLKLILIFSFASLSVLGILTSWVVSLVISFVISLVILIKKFDFRLRPVIKIDTIRKMFSFSFANYVSEFFERAPRAGIPLIITNLIGPQYSAYYYIDMSIALFLFMLPEAIGSSFYAESSFDEKELSLNTKKVLKVFFLILTPAILVVIIFGNYILLFFGKVYSREGSSLLSLLSLSTIFIAVNSLYSNILRIKYQMKKLILINFLGSLIILGLSFVLIKNSIIGVGWAWLIGNAAMSFVYIATTLWYKS